MQSCIHVYDIFMKMSCHMIYSGHGLPFPNFSHIFSKSISTQLFTLFSLYLENRFYIFKTRCGSVLLNNTLPCFLLGALVTEEDRKLRVTSCCQHS